MCVQRFEGLHAYDIKHKKAYRPVIQLLLTWFTMNLIYFKARIGRITQIQRHRNCCCIKQKLHDKCNANLNYL